MAHQWVRYITNFDKLMEEALRICCKNSLLSVYEALHGDGTTDPIPLLKIEVNLVGNKINFNPPLISVANVIANFQNTLVEVVKYLPKLNDKFHVTDERCFLPYSALIANDTECRNMQQQLNNEVRYVVEKIKEYIKVWEPFRDLWEVDKDKFIRRYEEEDPSAALFDANIGRYTELANNVQIQETVSEVYFLQINCANLKKAIIEHCLEWQEKLCLLLYNITERKLNDIYEYMDKNIKEISKEPQTLEHMQQSIVLHAQLKNDIPIQEEQFPQITDQIYTLDKYTVPIPPPMRIRHKHLAREWATYLENLETAEQMLEYSMVLVKDNLKSGKAAT